MNVMLLNDTATIPHIGCLAVSDAHARMFGDAGHVVAERCFIGELRSFANRNEQAGIEAVLADPELRSRIDACDAIVVNGEGTLHHGNGSEYFACLGAGQRLGKATLIVNAVFEAHAGWQATLEQLDDFCVRDLESLRHAHSLGFSRARLVPDSFMGAQFGGQPNIALAGEILVTDWHPARDGDVGNALRTILDSVDDSFFYPMLHGMHTRLWRGALADWSGASAILTARHHGVYLAACARKPFVALASNTKKIEGLMQAAGADIPVCTNTDQVEAAFTRAASDLGEYERLFDWLEDQTPLTTIRALGRAPGQSSAEAELARLEQQLGQRPPGTSPRFWGLMNGSGRGLAPIG